MSPSREACERFWKEQVRAKPREKWQLDQWGAAMRWYVRGLEYRKVKGGEVRSLPERLRGRWAWREHGCRRTGW